jgi:protoheme ferro-lyase
MKKLWSALFGLVVVIAVSSAFSTKQDDMQYRRYLHQDRTIEGKAGVLLTILGQPEHYEFEFFDRYLTAIFENAFPPALQLLILGDKGTVLMDPDHLEASEEFYPAKLVDCFGSETNEEGEPYVDLDVEWIEPREEDSPGHFLWKEHTNGYIDIVEKVSIKIYASYYERMPQKKIPFMHQHKALIRDFEKLLAEEFPGVPVRWALSMYPETIEEAVDELIHEKVDTIVAFDYFHVYSSLEEFNSLFMEIRDAVAERAKVVFTPFPSAYASYRKAYVVMAQDEILPLPKEDKKLVILTRHGFPEIPGEPYPELSRVFYNNMKIEIDAALAGTNTLVILADTDFAGEDMDPDEERLASFEALEMALEDEYDHVIFILVDFMTENTDSLFAHPHESLEPLHFKYEGEVPYYDFDKPFRLELQHGKTRVVSAGCPIGDRYRPHLSQGVFEAVATVLREEPWPELILEEEEKKEAMF